MFLHTRCLTDVFSTDVGFGRVSPVNYRRYFGVGFDLSILNKSNKWRSETADERSPYN
jgi:hypothetical protein